MAIIPCSQLKHKRFQDTHENTHFIGPGLSFQEYIEQMRLIILKSRIDLAPGQEKTILAANSPFEWKPADFEQQECKMGVLLIHGLFDSTFILQDIGKFMVQQKMLVRSILLPGHGTVPGDLLNIHYSEWLKAVRYGIESFSGEVDKLIVAGFSLGSTLAVHQALQGADLDALILFAPAFKIKSQVGTLATWLKPLSQLWQRAQWLRIREDRDYAKYESVATNAAYQVHALSKEVEVWLKTDRLNLPIFIAASLEDETVDCYQALEFFNSHQNPLNQFILYSAKEYGAADPRIVSRPSVFPEKNIIDFSHTCIPIAPDNTHYGVEGDYLGVFFDNQKRRFEYQQNFSKKLQMGSFSLANLYQHYIKRLSYNPDYETLLIYLKKFLEEALCNP